MDYKLGLPNANKWCRLGKIRLQSPPMRKNAKPISPFSKAERDE